MYNMCHISTAVWCAIAIYISYVQYVYDSESRIIFETKT